MKVTNNEGGVTVELSAAEQNRGLRPVDFYKLREAPSDDIEALYNIDPSLCSYGLPPDHITNVCSDEELQSLCFQRPGSLTWVREEASAALGVPADSLPDEMVAAWQKLYQAKQGGRSEYRTEYRRVCREASKAAKKALAASRQSNTDRPPVESTIEHLASLAISPAPSTADDF
jgi:hypothetical protein